MEDMVQMNPSDSIDQDHLIRRDLRGVFAEIPIAEPSYLFQQNWEKDYRNKNQHLIFRPANRYETWLAHGAIPFAFRSFICDQDYIGRGELALYVKLTLMFDQFGICYTTYEDLAEGMLSHPKQVQPLMANLIERHLILRSPTTVKIPWLRQTTKSRYVYQRPMAAHTVTRLHFIGFPSEQEEGGVRRLSKKRFEESARTLLQAYLSRLSERKRDEVNPLKSKLYQLESDDDVVGFMRILHDLFLTEEEKKAAPFDKGSEQQPKIPPPPLFDT